MEIFNGRRKQLAMILIAWLGLLMINACGKKEDNVSKSTVGTTVGTEESSIIESQYETSTLDTTLATEVKVEEIVTSSDATIKQEETTTLKVEETTKAEYTVTKLDKTMYAKLSVNVRKGPSADFERLGSLSTNQQVKVTGKSEQTGWFRIEFNGGEAYVSNNYLQDKPVETTKATTEYKEETTKVSMRDKEKTESPYYHKKDKVELVYKDNGGLDIKNTILGDNFNKNENMSIVYEIYELKEIVEKYSNTYLPVIGMYDLKSSSYAVTYPYYDVRDYAFWSYTYNKDGSQKDFIWFYFDEKFNAVYGDHPWWQYKMGGTLLPTHEVNADEVTDNNPNYHKKDIINFVYNQDGTANIRDTVIGEDADHNMVYEFMSNVKEIRELDMQYCYRHFGSISINKYYFDIRDYEYGVSSTGEEDDWIYYYWDENYNFVQKK